MRTKNRESSTDTQVERHKNHQEQSQTSEVPSTQSTEATTEHLPRNIAQILTIGEEGVPEPIEAPTGMTLGSQVTQISTINLWNILLS